MKRLLLLALIATFGLATPAFALADHIQVANNAPDAYVWVTNVDALFVNGKGGSYTFGRP